MPFRAATATLGCALVVAAPAAQAADVRESKRLWATVNVCDTPDHPNAIGIRASMPGLKRRSALWMRFRVQYRADSRWRAATGDGADSGWVRLGRQRRGAAESGWQVTFGPPQAGSYTLRGKVRFRWTRRGRTLERARRLTEAGHFSTTGADPPRYSAATCIIS